jgi:hypothetical protein
MKPRAATDETHKVAETNEAPERGHGGWKRRKIERGLAEAEKRGELIPGEQVWRHLGLES